MSPEKTSEREKLISLFTSIVNLEKSKISFKLMAELSTSVQESPVSCGWWVVTVELHPLFSMEGGSSPHVTIQCKWIKWSLKFTSWVARATVQVHSSHMASGLSIGQGGRERISCRGESQQRPACPPSPPLSFRFSRSLFVSLSPPSPSFPPPTLGFKNWK